MLCQQKMLGQKKRKMKKDIDILFVIPPYHKRNGSGSLFPLGTGAIMACLEQQNMSYGYIDCPQMIDSLYPHDLQRLEEMLKEKLSLYNPILVGIGPCVTPGIKGLEVVTRCCLEEFGSERVFAGGPFTLLLSQEWYFYERLGLKYLIKGDGENAVCEAVKTLKEGKPLTQCEVVSFQGHSFINIVKNLDEMPFPKRVGLESNVYSERRRAAKEGTKTAHIVASRGCPYHCAYCVSGNLKMPFRKRSAENIVEEMKMLKNQYGVSDIVFYDDCFFTGTNTVHREIERFCSALEKEKLHMTWQIEIRPDILVNLNDGELRRVSKLGCRQMNIGVEKTYDDGASVFGKPYDYEKLKVYLAHAHTVVPIRMTGTFILGGERETQDSVREIIKASADMNLDAAEYSPLFVYPDTPIYDKVFASPKSWVDVILLAEEPWGEIVYENDDLDKKTLIALVEEAYRCFYKDNVESMKVRDRYHLKG